MIFVAVLFVFFYIWDSDGSLDHFLATQTNQDDDSNWFIMGVAILGRDTGVVKIGVKILCILSTVEGEIKSSKQKESVTNQLKFPKNKQKQSFGSQVSPTSSQFARLGGSSEI